MLIIIYKIMKKSNHYSIEERGGWAVKKSGSTRITRSFDRKDEAIKFGREISRKQEPNFSFIQGTGYKKGIPMQKDPHPPVWINYGEA